MSKNMKILRSYDHNKINWWQWIKSCIGLQKILNPERMKKEKIRSIGQKLYFCFKSFVTDPKICLHSIIKSVKKYFQFLSFINTTFYIQNKSTGIKNKLLILKVIQKNSKLNLTTIYKKNFVNIKNSKFFITNY